MTIGVFDSGIGGLTTLKELIKKYPNNNYIYYGDSINIPYGNKTKEELEILVNKIIKFLLSKNVELIVIACGTVSSNLYSKLKKTFDVPIIDILTSTLDYIKQNNLKKIGVLATPMTIKSNVFQKNIKEIKTVSCPEFVPLIEKGIIKGKRIEAVVNQSLMLLNGCENIILGCTHYPLLIPLIEPNTTAKIINMSKCLVDNIYITNNSKLNVEIYFSKLNEEIKSHVNNIILCEKKIIERRI